MEWTMRGEKATDQDSYPSSESSSNSEQGFLKNQPWVCPRVRLLFHDCGWFVRSWSHGGWECFMFWSDDFYRISFDQEAPLISSISSREAMPMEHHGSFGILYVSVLEWVCQMRPCVSSDVACGLHSEVTVIERFVMPLPSVDESTAFLVDWICQWCQNLGN